MKSAFRIAIAYAVISVAWIVVTDALVAAFAGDTGAAQLYQVIKGLLFVSVSALLIFLLVARYAASMERAMRDTTEARESFERLFRENPVAIVAYDPETGAVQEANPAACHLFRRTREAFRRLSGKDWFPKPAAPKRFLGFPPVGASSLPVVEYHRDDGTTFLARLAEQEVAIAGSTRSTIAVIEDLSAEHERLSAQIEAVEARFLAERARANFLSMISHELRTPLNSVMGFLDLIDNTVDPQDWRTYVGVAKAQASTMLGLIDRLLDAAASRAGLLEVHAAPINLRDFAARLGASFESRCTAKGLDFQADVADDVPDWVTTDAVKLQQIVDQLLSNALKFSTEGAVGLAVYSDPSSREICLEVSDEGIGIPPERVGEIFEPFLQLDAGAARHYSGVGVGLFVVKRFTELLGGRLTVDSAPRRGTRFTVRLPAPT